MITSVITIVRIEDVAMMMTAILTDVIIIGTMIDIMIVGNC